MLYKRVIPCLLLKKNALVKTVNFNDAKYIGDPINTVRIFNEKEVDELIFLDIEASKSHKKPPFKLISNISRECFMPFAYGGGISEVSDADMLFELGVEKIALNNLILNDPTLMTKIADKYGNQSVIASIDVKKDRYNGTYKVFSYIENKILEISVEDMILKVEELGAGEILLTSVDKEGLMSGYDLELIKKATDLAKIPVIANGGAGSILDIENVFNSTKVNAVALGSMVVYQGINKAVLINFPDKKQLDPITRGN